MRRRYFSVILVIFLGAFSACDTPDFGDKVYAWVDSNAARVSRERAEADLPDRWSAAHEASTLGLAARLAAIQDRIAAIKMPSVDVPNDRALVKTLSAMTELNSVKAEIARARAGLGQWTEVCSRREFFDLAGMDRITTVPPVEPQVDENWQVYVGNDPVEAFNRMVLGNGVAYGLSIQNSRARAAQGRYRELAFQGDALFGLSKQICQKQSEAFTSTRSDIQATLSQADQTAASLGNALSLKRDQLERAIVPEDITKFLRERGLVDELGTYRRAQLNDDLRIRLRSARLALNDLARASSSAGDCEKRIGAAEDAEDGIVAVMAQIDTLLSSPSAFEVPVMGELKEHRAKYESDLSRLRGYLARIAAGGCL